MINLNSNNGRVMLIGDVSKAFSDNPAAAGEACRIYANIPDAIEAAAEDDFRAIAVVMPEAPAQLRPTLKALRKANPETKIILLANMRQEPAAINLVSTKANGQSLADDYLICPVQAASFFELQTAEATEPAMEDRIKQLEKLATEDDLTGLKNRRYIWEFARQTIARAEKNNGQVTLLIFDIDNFKSYNDLYGHSAGDDILKQAAVLMQRCCRTHDVVGRIGGDEFVVVFWDEPGANASGSDAERRSTTAKHPKEPVFIAKRFRRELEKTEFPLLGNRGKGVLTISGGLASFPRDGSTIEQILSRADEALLDAKRSGKNRIYLVGEPKNNIANIE